MPWKELLAYADALGFQHVRIGGSFRFPFSGVFCCRNVAWIWQRSFAMAYGISELFAGS